MTARGIPVEFDAAALGQWSEPDEFVVAAERTIGYANATNDPILQHLSGDVAPPLFAVVPIFSSLAQAAFMVAPPEVAVRVLHGKQDIQFHRPIRPGDVISTRVKPLGYEGKDNGTAAAFLLECRDLDGNLVNEQYLTSFYPKYNAGSLTGELAPDHRFDDDVRASVPSAVVTAVVDDDQTFRYSPAAGDPMPIHLDEDTARAAGLPGIIAHGLCTMAFTSWAALTELAGSQTERLRRIAVRFAKPVLPGQKITTTFWRATQAHGFTGYAFEVTVDDVVVIQDGWVEITD